MLNSLVARYVAVIALTLLAVGGFFLLNGGGFLFSKPETLTVKGYGDTDEAALADAKRKAIAKVCGETIFSTSRAQSEVEKNKTINSSGESSKSLTANSKISADDLLMVAGLIKSYKVLSGGRENNNFYSEVEVVVSECKKQEDNPASAVATVTELRSINLELIKLGSSDGLISSPKSMAEKYHNARILLQRGEIDRALPLFEEIISTKPIFADPIMDYATILSRMYGPVAASKYIDEKLPAKVPLISREYAKLLINKNLIVNENQIQKIQNEVKKDTNFLRSFPPFSLIFLQRMDPSVAQNDLTADAGVLLKNMVNVVIESIKSGDYYAYFFDQTRAEKDVQSFDVSKYSSSNDLLNKIIGEWFAYDAKYCENSPTSLGNSSRKKIGPKGFAWYRDDVNPMPLKWINESGGTISAYFTEKEGAKYGSMCLELQNITDKSALVKYAGDSEADPECKNLKKKKGEMWYRCTSF